MKNQKWMYWSILFFILTAPSIYAQNNVSRLPIAYIDIDSILIEYSYSKELNDNLKRQIDTSRNSLEKRKKNFTAQQEEFQQKIQNNAFPDADRATKEYEKLIKIGEDIDNASVRMEEELNLEQTRISTLLKNAICAALEEYNKSKKYQLIFTNMGVDNIIYADKEYNITHDFLKFLNDNYDKPDAQNAE